MKYVEDNIPTHMKARVVYLHNGNTSSNQLKKLGKTNTKYVTLAKLVDREDSDIVYAKGTASCSSKERPTRQIGRQVAIGRALAAYYGTQVTSIGNARINMI